MQMHPLALEANSENLHTITTSTLVYAGKLWKFRCTRGQVRIDHELMVHACL
jgi:hypothetical protein